MSTTLDPNSNILREIEDLLGTNSLNYVVDLTIYEAGSVPQDSAQDIVSRALGGAVRIGGIKAIDPETVWPLVRSSILWNEEAGGAGPSDEIMTSKALQTAMARLENDVRHLVRTATTVQSFWFEAGHPSYPVFWDFALLFRREESTTVFIGSSSD